MHKNGTLWYSPRQKFCSISLSFGVNDTDYREYYGDLYCINENILHHTYEAVAKFYSAKISCMVTYIHTMAHIHHTQLLFLHQLELVQIS